MIWLASLEIQFTRDVDGKTVQYRLSRPPVTPVLP